MHAVLEARCSTTGRTPWAVPFRAADPLKIPIDPNGNLTTKTEGSDTWTYSWNAENQLTKVEKNGAEVAHFAYDPMGRRVEKAAGGVTRSYTYDQRDILREARGGLLVRYTRGPAIDEPIAIDDEVASSCYHADGLGSVVRVTSTSGIVTLTRQYDVWGNLQTAAEQPGHAFTGREWDPEVGLYYYRTRYYDAKPGRFISEDPIGFEGGNNFYGYVEQNPVLFFDPLGLDVDICIYWNAAAGNGHLGFGEGGTGKTEGYYPKGNPFGGPGGIEPDTQDAKQCKTIKSDPNVDDCMRQCRERRRRNPGRYWLNSRNCSTFVHDCMVICGLKTGPGNKDRPKDFFRGLP